MNTVILIIDDEVSCRDSAALILKLEGFDVQKAEDGATGISMIREGRPDLILCDIMIPGLGGHSVLEVLKSDSDLTNIPFIFVTALNDRANMRFGMSQGADDYLTKPFTSEELLAAVIGRLHRFEMVRLSREKSIFMYEYALLKQQITEREMEILLLVGQGLTSSQIAKSLTIQVSTVNAHRANIMRKLDVPNAANLARWAVISELMSSENKVAVE